MDGTLTIAAHDFDLIRQQLKIPQGLPILEAIEKMPAAQAAKAQIKLHELEMEIGAQSRPQPGAQEVLALLQASGFSLGILTRNAEDIAHATLKAAGLANYFTDDDIIGRTRCNPKPDPAGILLLMAQWKASPNNTVMVGDYLFDLETGRNAAVSTVHFNTTGSPTWPDLTDVTIKRLEDLSLYL